MSQTLPVPAPPVTADTEEQSPWIIDEVEGPVPEAYLDGSWIARHPYLEWDLSLMPALDHQKEISRLQLVLWAHQETVGGPAHRGFCVQTANLIDWNERSRKPDLAFYWEAPPHFLRERGQPVSIRLADNPPPDLVIEVLSPKTWKSDVGAYTLTEAKNKMRDYVRMGIAEYWIVNPLEEELLPAIPRLQMFTLRQGDYVALEHGYSLVLDTRVAVDADTLIRVWNGAAEDWYPLDGGFGLRDAAIQAQAARIADLQDDNAAKDAAIQAQAARIAELERRLRDKDDRD